MIHGAAKFYFSLNLSTNSATIRRKLASRENSIMSPSSISHSCNQKIDDKSAYIAASVNSCVYIIKYTKTQTSAKINLPHLIYEPGDGRGDGGAEKAKFRNNKYGEYGNIWIAVAVAEPAAYPKNGRGYCVCFHKRKKLEYTLSFYWLAQLVKKNYGHPLPPHYSPPHCLNHEIKRLYYVLKFTMLCIIKLFNGI